jgi:hypothetical protein
MKRDIDQSRYSHRLRKSQHNYYKEYIYMNKNACRTKYREISWVSNLHANHLKVYSSKRVYLNMFLYRNLIRKLKKSLNFEKLLSNQV